MRTAINREAETIENFIAHGLRRGKPRYLAPATQEVMARIASQPLARRSYVTRNSASTDVLHVREVVYTLVAAECQLARLENDWNKTVRDAATRSSSLLELGEAWAKVGSEGVAALFYERAGEPDIAGAFRMRRVLAQEGYSRRKVNGWSPVVLQVSAAHSLLRWLIRSLRSALLEPPQVLSLDSTYDEERRLLRLARAVAEPLRQKVHWSSIRSTLARLHFEVEALSFYEGSKRLASGIDGVDNWFVRLGLPLRHAFVGASLHGAAETTKAAVAVALKRHGQSVNGGKQSALSKRADGEAGNAQMIRSTSQVFRGILRTVVRRTMSATGLAPLPTVVEGIQATCSRKPAPRASELVQFALCTEPGLPMKQSVYQYRLGDARTGRIRYGALNKAVWALRKDYESGCQLA